MFSDDGLGVYAVKYIEENFKRPPYVKIVDGGTLGFTLMTYYQEYDKVYIVSTTSIEGDEGKVHRFTKEALMDQGVCRQSANEVEVVQMLEICSLLEEMAEVEIIAMKPSDIMPVEANLTACVKAQFPKLIDTIIEAFAKDGVHLTPHQKQTSLDEIINAYANPTMPTHHYH
ncbi:MAG: hydrogenase maturation protease [Epsilonproteobacteria bacterium]|nr:hydrogenase maturation protease [Campylobacterota bacterium]